MRLAEPTRLQLDEKINTLGNRINTTFFAVCCRVCATFKNPCGKKGRIRRGIITPSSDSEMTMLIYQMTEMSFAFAHPSYPSDPVDLMRYGCALSFLSMTFALKFGTETPLPLE